MKLEKYKLKFPIALNTVDDPRTLLSTECIENTNLMTVPNGDIRAHYNWGELVESDTLKIIWGHRFILPTTEERLVVFGVKSDGGFLGYFQEGSTDITFIKETMSMHTIPHFVEYKKLLYIFAGVVLRYDGETLETSDVSPGSVGCKFRERLFVAAGGTLKFTEIGTETIEALNYFNIGNTSDPIINLIPLSYGVVIGKAQEVWDMVYDVHVADAKIRLRTNNAGIASHLAAKNHFNEIFFCDNKGAYILNPKNIKVNPDQLLEVDPGIIKISKPIEDLFSNYEIVPEVSAINYEKNHVDTTGPNAWDLNNFDSYFNIEVATNSYYYDYRGVRLRDYPVPEAWAISKVIKLPEGQQWLWITGFGWKRPLTGSFQNHVKLYLSDNNAGDWVEVDQETEQVEVEVNGVTEIGEVITWNQEMFNNLKDAPEIYYKVTFEHHGGVDDMAFIHNLKILTKPTIGSLFGTGYHDDRFYVFGNNKSGGRTAITFSKNTGWKKIQHAGYDIYNLFDEIRWDDEYAIIGFGKDSELQEGCLIKKPYTESHGSMTISGKTGEIDFGNPEIPKKIRKILITYKCSNAVTLNVSDDNGNTQQFTLPSHSEFAVEELNLSSSRSKWFDFEIMTSHSDFQLRDGGFEVWIKTFRPNET